MRVFPAIVAMAWSLAINPAVTLAQIPGIPGGSAGLPGGIAGLAGGVPDLSSMGAGNAAGILGYCVKNKLLGAGGAGAVISGLTGKPGLTSSPEYQNGQAGKLDLGSGSGLSMGSLQDKVKTRVCDMVLKHASSLL